MANYFKEIEKWDSGGTSEKEIKKWLYNRGIPFSQKVFLSLSPRCGFVLTWKMVIKNSSILFFGSDQTIFDRTLNWWLTFHLDGDFHFCKNRIYGPKQGYQDFEDKQKMIEDFKETAILSEERQKFSRNPYLKHE